MDKKIERPDIQPDTLIYVRDSPAHRWEMMYFAYWGKNYPICYGRQLKSYQTDETFPWAEYSLTNPLQP